LIIHRPADTRGNPRADFINSYRTFSFPSYYDSRYMNFSDLQTINDDRVHYAWQVPWHEHKNMEIFGYVIEGSSHHVDSLGNDVEVPAGAVQRMSAGSGISHTEGNTTNIPNRYLQLWIRPNEFDTEPRHDWYQFAREDKLNKFCNITEKLPIKQDARLLAGIFTEDFSYSLDITRQYYLYVVNGTATINNIDLIEGDGLSQWFISTSYVVDNVVWLATDNKIYRCITPNSDVTFTPANWVELSPSVLGEPVTFTQNVTFQQASIAALSIDWAAKGYLYKTISADSTFTFANAADGKQITLYIQNTDTADHAVTMPTCKWAGGDALGISVKAGHYNVYTFLQINGVLFASVNENMY